MIFPLLPMSDFFAKRLTLRTDQIKSLKVVLETKNTYKKENPNLGFTETLHLAAM